MKFIVLDNDKKKYGPIDEETLKKWVENGRVLPETPVRNILMRKWNKASDFDFLQTAFAVQVKKIEQEKGFKERFSEALSYILRKRESIIHIPKDTAFRHKYICDPANIFQRVAASLFDWMIILAYAFMLFVASSIAIQAGIIEVNMLFYSYFAFLLSGILLYFGLSLGLYAQTIGMWFWGILITKTDTGEVFLGRAYLFTVLMFVFNVADLLVAYINPAKHSIHEILSGTMLIKIAARPK